MNNIGEKYLPIGTVVLLKEGKKRLMITGLCSMPADYNSVMYDYAGCMYPEGFLSSDQTALFNHDQIQTIYHVGFSDDEDKKFKNDLKQLLGTMRNGTQNLQASAPASDVSNIAPVGPGLPGYTGPVPTSNVGTNKVAQPSAVMSNIKFDENGVVVSE